MIVTVHGNSSITITGLKVGETYTVTEITDWSWRYDFESWSFAINGSVNASGTTNGAAITLGTSGNVVTFTNKRSEDKWLDGDSYKNNIFNAAK